jgi:UDP-glucose 4-epimerase
LKILVTGGAGYIGSFVCRLLQEEGHAIVVADNLVYGHRGAVEATLESGDLLDREFLSSVLDRHRPEAVMHLAAWIEVGESVRQPAKYFANNTGGTALLLQAMAETGVKNLVFSSTAAVFGDPKTVPLTESSPKEPANPYGLSKLLSEMTFSSYAQAHGMRITSLRYFNAAGAALDGSIGEAHEPATHLITNAIKAALGQREFTLFGTDYDTPDGTCVRDYIHVLDIALAHVTALHHLEKGEPVRAYNLGTGKGYSNLQVLEAVKRVSGIDFPIQYGLRRPGDPPNLVADSSLIEKELGWRARHSDLTTIVESSWKWQSNHPDGYGDE